MTPEHLNGFKSLALTQTLRGLCFVTTGSIIVSFHGLPKGHPMVWGNMVILVIFWVMGLFELRRVRRVVAKVKSGEMLEHEFMYEAATLGSQIDRWINRWTLKGDPQPWWPVVGGLQGVAIGLMLAFMVA